MTSSPILQKWTDRAVPERPGDSHEYGLGEGGPSASDGERTITATPHALSRPASHTVDEVLNVSTIAPTQSTREM